VGDYLMLADLQKIVKDLIPNSPIQFFKTLPFDGVCKEIAGLKIPVLNDLLVRETIIEEAIRAYAALLTIDYRIEYYALCDIVQRKFDLLDKDALSRVKDIVAFEIQGEGDLNFLVEHQEDIRNLTLTKLKRDNLSYLFPYYFVLNRTGKELDLTLLPRKSYSNLLDFIDSEKDEPDLNQLDDGTTIKKP
jgi:hypothetical protein